MISYLFVGNAIWYCKNAFQNSLFVAGIWFFPTNCFKYVFSERSVCRLIFKPISPFSMSVCVCAKSFVSNSVLFYCFSCLVSLLVITVNERQKKNTIKLKYTKWFIKFYRKVVNIRSNKMWLESKNSAIVFVYEFVYVWNHPVLIAFAFRQFPSSIKFNRILNFRSTF